MASLLVGDVLEAQDDSPAKPVFEVASVKINHSEELRVSGDFLPGGRYQVRNYPRRAWKSSGMRSSVIVNRHHVCDR